MMHRLPTTTIPSTTQTHVFTLPAIGTPQEALRLLHTDRIVAALARHFRVARVGGGRRAVPALQRDPAELDARPAADPLLRRRSDRDLQVAGCGVNLPERRPRGAALVMPQAVFAGNLRPAVLCQ